MERFDRAQIARMVRLLYPEPDALWECRVLAERGTFAGYYSDMDRFISDVERRSGEGNCYITLNTVHPDCAARVLNRSVWAKRNTLTKDNEILRRKALFLDFDPCRMAGIASTDEEHQAALEVALAVRSWLDEHGWPQPIYMSSGNGAYLIYRIELPPDDGKLIHRVLKELAGRFDSERVKIDTSVHNPARIARIAGTLNMKGENTPQRPHRLATILDAPDVLESVPADLLSAIVDRNSSNPPAAPLGDLFDIGAWLLQHQVSFSTEPANDGIRYRLSICPNKGPGHEDGRTWIFQRNDGWITAGCFHAKCAHLRWNKLRTLIDPSFDSDAEASLTGDLLERPKDCHRFARVMLADTRHSDGSETFALEGDTLYRWADPAWHPVSDADFRRELTKCSKREADRLAITALKRGLDGTAIDVTVNLINSVRNALLSMLPQAAMQPSWLNSPGHWPADEVLACSDGLIHLPSFAAGDDSFRAPLSPNFFSTLNLGYQFDPAGKPPILWYEFLNQIWETDAESVLLLQEWLGYLLTLDTTMQKMAVMFGPGGAGKGTILEVTRHLIGAANVTSLTLPMLGESHALETLVGKSLCIFPDASVPQRMDRAPLVEALKSITGEDLISINPKHKPRYAVKLNTRLMVATNEMLDLPDPSGALDRRLLVLRFSKTFNTPDTRLRQKLLGELPGILLWAIEGWKRLREQGYFTEAASGREVRTGLKEISSPILAFIAECCDVGPNESVAKDVLFETWKSWCGDNGVEAGGKGGLIKLLRAAVPHIRASRPRVDGSRLNAYTGISLKSEASVEEPDVESHTQAGSMGNATRGHAA